MHWQAQSAKFLTCVREISDAQLSLNLAVKAYNLKAITKFSYALQFLPPPPDLTKLEKYAFAKIFKLPFNAVSHAQQFMLERIGMPQLISMESLSIAIKARYFHAHESLIKRIHSNLIESCDSLSVACMWNLSRSHWTWPPAVHTLYNNFFNSPHSQEISQVIRSVDNQLQKAVNRTVTEKLFENNLQELFVKRCMKYLPEQSLQFLRAYVNFFHVFDLSQQFGPHINSSVFKTLIGGWITNRRTQAEPRACIFCAQAGGDSLQHMIDCDTL
eukprot:8946573-Karenia_brevis.AAC.1